MKTRIHPLDGHSFTNISFQAFSLQIFAQKKKKNVKREKSTAYSFHGMERRKIKTFSFVVRQDKNE